MAREASHKQDEFLEAAFDFGQWIERHWQTVLRYAGVVVAVMIVVAAVFGWQRSQATRAKKSLALGTAAFDKAAQAAYTDFDALADALAHFEAAEKKAGSSAPGPLATYYRGVTLYRLGRKQEAVEALESFAGSAPDDEPLAWAATALLANLHAGAGDTARAVELLESASGADSGFPVDQVLMQLGRIQADAGNREAANAAWQRVVDEFETSPSAREARRLLAG